MLSMRRSGLGAEGRWAYYGRVGRKQGTRVLRYQRMDDPGILRLPPQAAPIRGTPAGRIRVLIGQGRGPAGMAAGTVAPAEAAGSMASLGQEAGQRFGERPREGFGEGPTPRQGPRRGSTLRATSEHDQPRNALVSIQPLSRSSCARRPQVVLGSRGVSVGRAVTTSCTLPLGVRGMLSVRWVVPTGASRAVCLVVRLRGVPELHDAHPAPTQLAGRQP
jgi:hypothetical protein